MILDEFDACTADDLRAEAAAQRRYRAALTRHPDPRDPDYPGDTPDISANEQEAM